MQDQGLLSESISKRVKKNDDAMKRMIRQNKQMLAMIGRAADELSAEITTDGSNVIIPQKRFNNAESLLRDINAQAAEALNATTQTAQLLAEANEQLKVIEIETYNNFKLMANGLITETITHELHSVSKTSVDQNIPKHFDFLKRYFSDHQDIGRMKRDRVLVLCAGECRLLTAAMLAFRNKLLAGGKPTEDVNELLLRLVK